MVAELHMPIASLVDISSPKGAPWEFLVVFATLLIGPLVVQRARIPGIIGLLLGGYVIGPHGLGLIGSGNSTLPDLGQLGLLYLMFVAGVELDLNLLRRYRRSTVVFGLITFSFPMAAGTIVGLALGWEVEAAILLGSLLASHTLLAYPAVRDAGQASDPSVATVVGSTVLTDTLALIVLAGVAGSAGGDRSAIEVAIQLIVGLSVLIGFSLLVLPALAGWAFRLLGAQRSVRYVVAITAFLSAATVAELFGIEGIVGAFFAGLALNRLVPNEGQLMDRIGFFGGAVFIPVFLVSVGLILNPAVMVEGETLKLAAFFILACLGGKALAATLSARLLGFSRPQAGLLFALSSAQAAATLAATVIGFQLGLFDSSVVNAVLVLILVSVIVSTVVATRASARLTSAEHGPRPLGTRVVVGMRHPDHARGALLIAVRIARADGGVVYPVLVLPDTAPVASKATRERFEKVVAAAGVDGLPSTIVDGSLQHGAIHAGEVAEATLVLVAEQEASDDEASDDAAPTETASPEPTHGPVALVSGSVERLGIVRMFGDLGPEHDGQTAEEIATRVAGGAAARLDQDDDGFSERLDPQDVTFASAQDAEKLAALPDSERGIVITMLDESAQHEGHTATASEPAPG
jgi:Kef-type K+ transport system membrane component KefB